MAPEATQEWLYYEAAAFLPGGGMDRDNWLRADRPQDLVLFRERFDNKDVFTSVCRFAAPDRDSRYICPFFLDTDAERSDELKGVRQNALALYEVLGSWLGITPASIQAWFSGCRGFHIVVPAVAFEAVPSPHLMAFYRHLAEQLSEEGLELLDLAIYQKARLWRLADTVNSKSGRYKIRLKYEELKDWSADKIRQKAQGPRALKESGQAMPSPKAAGYFKKTLADLAERKERTQRTRHTYTFKDGWRVPPCIRNIHNATLADGLRHTTYIALARFYGWINMHPEEAADRLHTIDKRHPIRDPGYIERIVDWGKQNPGFVGCENAALRKYCEPGRCFVPEPRRHRKEKQEGKQQAEGKGLG